MEALGAGPQLHLRVVSGQCEAGHRASAQERVWVELASPVRHCPQAGPGERSVLAGWGGMVTVMWAWPPKPAFAKVSAFTVTWRQVSKSFGQNAFLGVCAFLKPLWTP